MNNIFENLPGNLDQEYFETLLKNGNVKIERIISRGHASPENFWYDQDKDEFVLLLRGSAKLIFENDESVHLKPGDYLNIPAHQKHRVEETDPDELTFWLTVHH